jgi:Mg-chelatase subunit ChlD
VTHIGFVVDTSGSMHTLYRDVVEQGIEVFLEDQKKLSNRTLLYGLTFNQDITVIFDGTKDIKDIDNMKDAFYSITPSGSTAYFDALKRVVGMVDDSAHPGDEVVICCMTDGQDNASRTSVSELKELVTERKRRGWILSLIGTKEADIETMCDHIGIGRDAGLQMGGANATQAYTSLSRGIDRVRNGVSNNLVYTQTERFDSQ